MVARARRTRGGRIPVIDRIPRWGTVLMWVFLTGSAVFSTTSGFGAFAIVRVLARMVGIDVAAA
jgi:hypothetical protein